MRSGRKWFTLGRCRQNRGKLGNGRIEGGTIERRPAVLVEFVDEMSGDDLHAGGDAFEPTREIRVKNDHDYGDDETGDGGVEGLSDAPCNECWVGLIVPCPQSCKHGDKSADGTKQPQERRDGDDNLEHPHPVFELHHLFSCGGLDGPFALPGSGKLLGKGDAADPAHGTVAAPEVKKQLGSLPIAKEVGDPREIRPEFRRYDRLPFQGEAAMDTNGDSDKGTDPDGDHEKSAGEEKAPNLLVDGGLGHGEDNGKLVSVDNDVVLDDEPLGSHRLRDFGGHRWQARITDSPEGKLGKHGEREWGSPVNFELQGVTVSLKSENRTGRPELWLCTELIEVPDEHELEIYRLLLEANLLWQGTADATIGVNSNTRLALLAFRAPIQELDAERLLGLLNHFVETALAWRLHLQQHISTAASAGESLAVPSGSLRV